MLPSARIILFLLTISSSILLIKTDTSSTQVIQIISNGTIPSKTALPNITIVPNVTQQVILTIKSSVDTIVFTFVADPYDIGDYRLVVTNNGRIRSSQTAQFPNGQVIIFSLDTAKKTFYLNGNGDFRQTTSVQSKQYSFSIYQQLQVITSVPEIPVQPTPPAKNINGTVALYYLAGILGGIFFIVVAIKIIITVINRRKRSILPQTRPQSVPAPTMVNERLSKLKDQLRMSMINTFPSSLTMDPTYGSPGYKGSLNLDEKVVSDQETDHLTPNPKKDFSNSITSIDNTVVRATTAASFSKLPSSGSLGTIGRNSGLSSSRLDAVESRKSKRLMTMDANIPFAHQHNEIQLKVEVVPEEAVNEESSPQKGRQADVLTFGPEMIRVKEKSFTTRKTKYQVSPFNDEIIKPSGTVKSDSKRFTFEQSQVRSTVISKTIFSEDCDEFRERKEIYAGRFKPRHKILSEEELRPVVDRILNEQEENKDKNKRQPTEYTDSSEEEEDEHDEFQLPNYRCCMICLTNKRNIVMQPCQHIFACKSCSKKVMNTSKICLLCSGKIKRAYKLKE